MQGPTNDADAPFNLMETEGNGLNQTGLRLTVQHAYQHRLTSAVVEVAKAKVNTKAAESKAVRTHVADYLAAEEAEDVTAAVKNGPTDADVPVDDGSSDSDDPAAEDITTAVINGLPDADVPMGHPTPAHQSMAGHKTPTIRPLRTSPLQSSMGYPTPTCQWATRRRHTSRWRGTRRRPKRTSHASTGRCCNTILRSSSPLVEFAMR
jgi:hypothetical protein